MSIIIKGMEMPRGCNDCHRCYWSNLDQSYKCDLTKSELQVKDAMIERNDDCPLIEIPKGARLIDANKLISLYSDRMEKVVERYEIDSSEAGILSGAMKLLQIQPNVFKEEESE